MFHFYDLKIENAEQRNNLLDNICKSLHSPQSLRPDIRAIKSMNTFP